MLRKPTIVTVTPAVPGREFKAATHTCYSVPPPGSGGDSDPPPDPPPAGSVVPPAGFPIVLQNVAGIRTVSVAPAPVGYVCRYETVIIYTPGTSDIAAIYYVVCTES